MTKRLILALWSRFFLAAILVQLPSQIIAGSTAGSERPNAGGWPKLHADAANTGRGIAAGGDGTLKWTFTDPGILDYYAVGESAVTGPDGTVYICTGGELLRALDPASGIIKWSFAAQLLPNIAETPTVGADGTVYFNCGDGTLYSINPSTGAENWSIYFAFSGDYTAAPAIGPDGTIYVLEADGNFYAISPAGTIKWAIPMPYGSCFDPASISSDGFIYISSILNGSVYKIEPVAGQVIWQSDAKGSTESNPAIGPDGTVYSATGDGLFALDPSTGVEKWSNPRVNAGYSTPAVSSDGTIYVGADNSILCLDGATGEERWSSSIETGEASTDTMSSPAIGADGAVYIIGSTSISNSAKRNFYAFDGQSGTVKWSQVMDSAAYAYSSPSIGADGTVYCPDGTFHLYAFAPPNITNLYASPSAVYGGNSTSGVVQLYAQAPPAGDEVTLNTNSAALSPPSPVTIEGGTVGKSFTIDTSPVSTPTQVTLSASLAGKTLTTTVTLNPYPLSNFYASPAATYGGNGTSGVVQIAGLAGPTDSIALSSSSTLVTVPAQVTIPANAKGISFPITTSKVTAATQVVLTAAFQGVQKQTTVTLDPVPAIASLTFNNTGPFMTYQITGAVTLASPAPVALPLDAWAGSSYASLSGQPVIAAGHTTGTFIVTANPIPVPIGVKTTINVSNGSQTASQGLEIRPIVPIAATFSPPVLHAGESGVLNITTGEAAGAISFPVTVRNSSSLLSTPSTATMPPHSYQLQVAVKAAGSITGTSSISVYVSAAGEAISASVTVEP